MDPFTIDVTRYVTTGMDHGSLDFLNMTISGLNSTSACVFDSHNGTDTAPALDAPCQSPEFNWHIENAESQFFGHYTRIYFQLSFHKFVAIKNLKPLEIRMQGYFWTQQIPVVEDCDDGLVCTGHGSHPFSTKPSQILIVG
jgi:hypothetical protein